MKQLERSELVTYRWWRAGKKNIKPGHVEALAEKADERISEMAAQGYMSGELNANIYMTDADTEDGVE